MKYGVEIVITAIVFLLVLFTVGYIMRKKYYKEIDQLETRKLELMHRPVVDELAKVKRLNMTGQTEELFERWRQSWDDLVAVQLPNIDEMLFDGEEYTDKYRFKRAKETFKKIDSSLTTIESQIEKILAELAELIGSEEKNRTDIEELAEKYRNAKKNLLAHRHTYGVAANKLEELLESAAEKIANYEAKTEQGDYLEARQVVLSLAAEMNALLEKMDKVPQLLIECNTVIPSQKSELADGYREMMNQGFVLDHLQIDKQFEKIDQELSVYTGFLKNTETEEVENGIEEIKEKIDLLYDVLEKEVYAKHYVVSENEKTGFIIDQLKGVNDEIKEETDLIRHTYHLLDDEIEEPKNFEKSLAQLAKRFEMLMAKMEDDQSAFTMLSEELKYIESQLSDLQERQKEFSEKLHNLRKDELEAREKVDRLQKKTNDVIRMVKKSRMPGLPSDFESLFEQAEEQIEDVFKSLNSKPLNMKSVQKFLYEATDTVEHLYERTEEHIDNARFAEKVIQYGNRYRGRDLELRASLDQAEAAFRNYEYKSALEQAATAVEKVEPGALKRIEEMMNEEAYM